MCKQQLLEQADLISCYALFIEDGERDEHARFIAASLTSQCVSIYV